MIQYGILGTIFITCFVARFILIKGFMLTYMFVNPKDWPEENGY